MTAFQDLVVAHWSLEETSGSRADDTASALSLTSNNSVGSTTGKVGTAASFTAASSMYLSRASGGLLQLGDTHWHIVLWVKFTTMPASGGEYQLVTKDTDSPANSRDFTVDYKHDAAGFRAYINGGGSVLVNSGVTAVADTWYLLVVSHNPDSNTLSIQINGGSITSTTTAGIAPQTSTAEFRIGARQYSGFEGYLNGAIDQVLIMQGRALTTYERAYIYNHGDGQSYSSLVSGTVELLGDFPYLPLPYSGNPIIPNGAGGTWNEDQIFDFQFLDDPNDSSKILMYVSGMFASAPSGVISIGLYRGSKSDPYGSWVEDGGTGNGQVFLPSGVASAFDESHVRMGCIVRDPDTGTFYLYYTGQQAATTFGVGTRKFGVATSTDGVTFTRYGSNPILSPGGSDSSIEEPTVIPPWTSGLDYWVMIYNFGLWTATSPDGLTWTKTGNQLFTTRADGSFATPQWIAVRKIGERYFMIYEDGNLSDPTNDPYACYVAESFHPLGPFVPMQFPTPLMPASGVPATWDYAHTATPTLVNISGTEYLFYTATADLGAYSGPWPVGIARCIDSSNLKTIHSDTFTDVAGTDIEDHAAETSVAPYVEVTGTFKIDGTGTKLIPNSTNNDDTAVTDTGVADAIIQASMSPSFSGGADAAYPGVTFRLSDSSHKWLVLLNTSDQKVEIYEDSGAGYSLHSSSEVVTLASGTVYSVIIAFRGASIAIYLDDVLVKINNLIRSNITATKIGPRLGKLGTPPGVASWDNIIVQEFAVASSSGGSSGARMQRLLRP